MNKAKTLVLVVGMVGLLAGAATLNAAVIRLLPVIQNVNVGQVFHVEIRADIDTTEAILGYGFDLTTLGPSNVTLSTFSPGASFADDPVFLAPLSDADGIRGASGGDLFSGVPVAGVNILLGTLNLVALNTGQVDIGIGADDLNFLFTEGLIFADINLPNSLPQVDTVRIIVSGATPTPTPVLEPPTLLIFALGLLMLTKIRQFARR